MWRLSGAPALVLLMLWAGDGIFAGFSGDDLMNLHGHWMTPLHDLLLQLIVPLEDAYRPLGGLAYRLFYGAFGLNPLPWRLFCFGVLALDLVLAARLMERLTGSATAAAAGATAIAYQARMADLYYNGGTVYELLCFAAMLVAVRTYVDLDATRVEPKMVVLTVGAAIAAWGAKEMAAALPLLLLGWELCLGEPWRRLGARWNSRNISLILVSAVSLALSWSKASAGNPLRAAGAYQPSLTLNAWLSSTAHYLDQLFYRVEFFEPLGTALVFAGLVAVALALRRAEARFAAAWIALSALPIAFITPRSGFAYFIPSLGWALMLAAAWAASPLRSAGVWPAAAGFALVLAPFHLAERPSARWSVMEGVEQRQAVLDGLRPRESELCAGAAMVIENDPFEDETMVFLGRLLCGDRDVIVRRAGSPARPDEAVVRFAEGDPEVQPPREAGLPPAAELRIKPPEVYPGEPYRIEAPELAGDTIDVVYLGGEGYFSQVGVIEGFAVLDASGGSVVETPSEQAPGTTTVTHVRGKGPWRKAGVRVTVLSANR